MRSARLRVLATLLGLSMVFVPAAAGTEPSPTIEAFGGYYGFSWHPSEAIVASGEAVTIANHTEVAHGVEWRSAIKPSCEEGAGKVPVGTTPTASGKAWSGQCTFSQPGSYTFWCTVHGSTMSGVVTVTGTPTATTEAPSQVTQTGATLNGAVKPEGLATSYYFEYGPTSSFGAQIPLTAQSVGSDFNRHPVSTALSGLKPGTEYHVQLVATYGAEMLALGGERVFTTPTVMPPTVETGAASAVTETEATLNGTVDANGVSGTGYFFKYGPSPSYGHTTALAAAPVDNLDHAVSATLAGLAPGSEYHFRLIAKNAGDTTEGMDETFSTRKPPETPSTTTTQTTTSPNLTNLMSQLPVTVGMLTSAPPHKREAAPALIASSLALTAPRHGPSVRGSIDVTSSGAGGRLEVDLLAKGVSVAANTRRRPVLLGRLVRASVPAGKVTFSATLGARGKSMLRQHRRLALTVRITFTPQTGAAVVVVRNIVLRE